MNNNEIKFKTWQLTSDTLVGNNSCIPLDHISHLVFIIKENEYEELLLFLAFVLAELTILILFVLGFKFYVIYILIIAALLVYIALIKYVNFKVYSSSGQFIEYNIYETNSDKFRNDVKLFNLFIDELLQRKRDYLNFKK